jgi:CRISPR system Cascade subunit CasC
MMGGTNRIRISSQCLKRSVRRWAEGEGELTTSVRTREVSKLIETRLNDDNLLAEDDRGAASALVGGIVEKLSGSGDQVLAFFGKSEIDRLVDLAAKLDGVADLSSKEAEARRKDLKAEVESVLSQAESAVALFGRMFADTPKISVDGAVQMAHAFTVHEAVAELDYFTAVEDWVSDDSHSGAGHLNTNEFSSGTFYKYANVGVRELLHNVHGDAAVAASLASAFVRGFVLADPSGKQTSTAARTLPDLVYLAVEDRRPVSLASAFERPVRSRDGYRENAIDRLDAEAASVGAFLGAPSASGHIGMVHVQTANLGQHLGTLDDLVAMACGAIG